MLMKPFDRRIFNAYKKVNSTIYKELKRKTNTSRKTNCNPNTKKYSKERNNTYYLHNGKPVFIEIEYNKNGTIKYPNNDKVIYFLE